MNVSLYWWIPLASLASLSVIVTSANAYTYNVSFWRMFTMLNGACGTLFTRGWRAAIAEIDTWAERQEDAP